MRFSPELLQRLPVVARGERGLVLNLSDDVVLKLVFEKPGFPAAGYARNIEVEAAALGHAESLGIPAPRLLSHGLAAELGFASFMFKGATTPVLGWMEMTKIKAERAGDVLERDPSTAPAYAKSLALILHRLHQSSSLIPQGTPLKPTALLHLREKARAYLERKNEPLLAGRFARLQNHLEEIITLPPVHAIHGDIHDWNVMAHPDGEVAGVVDWSMFGRADRLHEFYDFDSGERVADMLLVEYEKVSGASFSCRDVCMLRALKALSLAHDFPDKEEWYVKNFVDFAQRSC